MKILKPSQKVYYYQSQHFSNSENSRGISDEYDIDASADVLLAKMTQRSKGKNVDYFLPGKKWRNLVPEAREI